MYCMQVAALVDGLVEDGFIPAAKIRSELQDVWPLARGFVGVGGGGPMEPLHCTHTALIAHAHCTLHIARTLHAPCMCISAHR